MRRRLPALIGADVDAGAAEVGTLRAVRRLGLVVLLSLLAGCDACSCGAVPSSLRASGAAPFARCAAVRADDREWSASGLDLEIDDATLHITGSRRPRVAVAITAGPWPVRASATSRDVDALVRALRARVVSAVVVLGGVGDDEADASALLARLARADAPIVVVPGLSERWDAATDAVEHDEDARIVDGTGLRRIVVGNLELLLLAGSDGGAYGVRDACGFDDEDLAALGALSTPRGAVRVLASVVAPRGVGPAAAGIGVAGAPAGSARLSRFVQRAHIAHVLSAWPVENAGVLPEGAPISAVVPSLGGFPRIRHDGTRVAPGAVVVTVAGSVASAELLPR